MKILMVNKFHYIKGGSETYYFALKKLLESQGHIVIDFSMKDEKNFHSPYSEYFVENVDYSNCKGIVDKIKTAANIIYSFEAKHKFEELVCKEKPDLIHLHIFQHQISPSILDVIKKYNIPTVYTAHDLKMVCLNYKMMHHGKVCEDCARGCYFKCFQNKCVKESASKSLINVVEGYLHKYRKSYDIIDRIVTPSDFYRRKFIEFGVAADRLVHIPNFLDRTNPEFKKLEDSKEYYLYFGRLSEEKGVLTLIRAMNQIKGKLKIVGTGPMMDSVRKSVKLANNEHIQILGFKSGQELIDIVANAKAVILPSEWYENGPYSAIEALQMGRPIIGANIGGIPELVDGNGYLFESGNAEELAEKIGQMERLSDLEYKEMEQASERLFKSTYTSEVHKLMLEKVYKVAMERKKAQYE